MFGGQYHTSIKMLVASLAMAAAADCVFNSDWKDPRGDDPCRVPSGTTGMTDACCAGLKIYGETGGESAGQSSCQAFFSAYPRGMGEFCGTVTPDCVFNSDPTDPRGDDPCRVPSGTTGMTDACCAGLKLLGENGDDSAYQSSCQEFRSAKPQGEFCGNSWEIVCVFKPGYNSDKNPFGVPCRVPSGTTGMTDACCAGLKNYGENGDFSAAHTSCQDFLSAHPRGIGEFCGGPFETVALEWHGNNKQTTSITRGGFSAVVAGTILFIPGGVFGIALGRSRKVDVNVQELLG